MSSILRFKVPKDTIPTVEEFCKKTYPKSFERNFVRYLYVIDYVCRGTYRHRKVVPIYMARLSKILGVQNSDASKILKSLTSIGILEKVSSGVAGVKSSTYSLKIKDNIINSIPFEVFTHRCTKQIIEMRNKSSENMNTVFMGSVEQKNLANYLLSISIDPSIISNIISHPFFNFSYLPPYDGEFEGEDDRRMIQEFKLEFQNIVAIHNKEIFMKRVNNVGRVYTPFTVMDREHRPYLNYEGQVLKCLDIANSQPLIFCAFIKKYCKENDIILPQEEYETYKSLVEKGVFYERFMEGDEHLPEKRKEFKQNFFGSVFYTKVSNIPYPLRKRFVKVFPKIYGIMDDIKKNHGNDGFALLMQEEEARIVWDSVNAPMLREGYLCYNIYDSIVSHDMETIKEAERRLKLEFNKIGISPTFKLEVFE